jgi:hypothetical protein
MRCRRPLVPASVIVVAAVLVLTAGCGGGSATTAATTTQGALLTYSHCMRSHGVPNFPDPDTSGEIPKDKVIAALGNGPQSQAAQRACQYLMPASGLGPSGAGATEPRGTRLADALSFARCMRTRGFPSFPDPTSQGQLTPEMVTAAGIDLHQPSLLSAGLACVPDSHGLLTRTAIERAVRGG